MILFTTEAQSARREEETSTDLEDYADFDLRTDGSLGRKNRLGKTAGYYTLDISHVQLRSAQFV